MGRDSEMERGYKGGDERERGWIRYKEGGCGLPPFL